MPSSRGQEPEITRRHYARSQGVSEDDERVKRYAGDTGTGTHEREVDEEQEERPFVLEDEDPRFQQAVMNYAQSQNMDLDDERVIKYAKGLKSRTGDFGGREQDAPVGRRK